MVDLRPLFQEGRRIINILQQALTVSTYLCIVVAGMLFLITIRRDRWHKRKQIQTLYDLGVDRRTANRWAVQEYHYSAHLMVIIVAIAVYLITYVSCYSLRIPFRMTWSYYIIALVILWSLTPLIARWNKMDFDTVDGMLE